MRQLMEEVPTTEDDLGRLRTDVDGDRLLHDTLLSPDRTATVIVAEFDDRMTDVELMRRVEALVAPERAGPIRIALAGAPVLRAALQEYTRLIGILFPLAVVVIGLVHYEAFRTLQALLLPLVTALLSVVWALGIMGALRLPMDTWSALMPVLILAVAAGHAVQILKRYYEEYARVGDSTEAVVRAVVAVGPVMLTAGLIAVAGFASLTTFGVTSVASFRFLGPEARPFDFESMADVSGLAGLDRRPALIGRPCVRPDHREVRSGMFVHVGLLKLTLAYARKHAVTGLFLYTFDNLISLYRTAFFEDLGRRFPYPPWGDQNLMHLDVGGLEARCAASRSAIARLLLDREMPGFVV